ncbi:hypothetical protein BKA64DRAFT_124517 [Cadophora sp. MPI-SDFR-AT-0126]|nr:hypothetical protein BKA64DRAFT_124517 [Leotiomycetes sp. MPI-SDFR-AT-0126]
MATTTTTSSTATNETVPSATISTAGRVFAKGLAVTYGDFRDDLLRDGFAVVKGAIPRDRADGYVEEMYQWLENFGLGFKRDDPSTFREDHMPVITEKGMCLGYGIAHEKFTWAIRSEPGVVGAFEKVYDTEDLIVSFDCINFSFSGRSDLKPNKPWPHQDQDPKKPGFRCLQGLVNLLPNGPDDGGLIVCKGGHLVSEEFHENFKDEKDKIWAWTNEWYGITESGMKWLENKGLKWEKVCAEPGDLIVWDSRTPHFNLTPTSQKPRFCAYTCFMPVEDATQEDLIRKKAAFENCESTTHWPNAVHVGGVPVNRGGKPDPLNHKVPKSGRPVLSERAFKLTGIPYIKASV